MFVACKETLNLLKRFTFCFWQLEVEESEADAANGAEEPEGTMELQTVFYAEKCLGGDKEHKVDGRCRHATSHSSRSTQEYSLMHTLYRNEQARGKHGK